LPSEIDEPSSWNSSSNPGTASVPVAIKKCGCGRTYDKKAWDRLLFVGIQNDWANDQEYLELRNCFCGSTISLRKSVRLPRRSGASD
jgi:hypothetical protein